MAKKTENLDTVKQLADLEFMIAKLVEAKPKDEGLEDTLYRAYSRNAQEQVLSLRQITDTANKLRFTECIARHNTSRFTWTPGHSYLSTDGTNVRIKGPKDQEITAPIQQFDGPGPDGAGRLLGKPWSDTIQAAWYYCFGEDGLDIRGEDMIRLYWAITAQGAPLLIHSLTKRLNHARVPFQVKTFQDPQSFGRGDSAVLYMPTYVWDRCAPILEDIHQDVQPWLNPNTPCFTKELAPGVGFAEDPGDGASFGLTRSQQVAKILKRHAPDWRTQPPKATTKKVVPAMRRLRIQPGRSHLRPNTKRDYNLPGGHHD